MGHSFVVGQIYRERSRTYTVVSAEGNRLIYDYGDGVQHVGDAETRWRIHCNILSETSPPQSTTSHVRPRTEDDKFWTFDEVFPIFAEVIETYCNTSNKLMSHEEIVAAFIEHPDGQRILSRRHDGRRNQYWAGVMLAWFSRVLTERNSEWESKFEREKIGGAWAYRVRRK